LGNQAVLAAPAGLAATVTGAVLVSAVAGGGGAALVTFMSMTKLQVGIAGAVIALGVGGVVVQINANAALRDELADLRGQAVGMAALAGEHARLVRDADEVGLLRGDDAKLARLGEEAAKLKAQMGETARVVRKGAGSITPVKLTGEVFAAAKVDLQPKPTIMAQPKYPSIFRSAAVEGEAVVELVVDAGGKVHEAKAVSFTHQEFEAAAVEAVRKWEFRPGQKSGRAVNTRVRIPIVFTIGKDQGKLGDWF
jgi:TonB family protein